MSFEELTRKISSKLKGVVYKVHRAAPSFSMEDLYQEAILDLWVDYQEGKLSDKTDSYILQGCYFYLKNYVRSSREKTTLVSMDVPINEEGTELKDVLPASPAAFDGPDMDELMERVFQNDLSYKEKEVAFFYLQGWTTREIAERLGVSHVSIVKIESNIRGKCIKLKNSV